MVTICTTCFNIIMALIMPIVFTLGIRMIPKINSDYCPTEQPFVMETGCFV
jgi:hypothetical protein